MPPATLPMLKRSSLKKRHDHRPFRYEGCSAIELLLGHPELTGHEDWVANALLHPQEVRRSISDPTVMLFYQFRSNTIAGDKWFCVVAKYVEDDAFVVTAYLTDKLKKGDLVWRNP